MPASMNLPLLLPELVLVATGIALVLIDLFTEQKRVLAHVGLVGVLATLAALVPGLGESRSIWSDMIQVDGFATFFKVVFLSVAALVLLVSLEYVERERIQAGEFYALVLFATLGMFFMAGSLNLLTIYLGLELLSISSYVLAGTLKRDPRSVEASIKYFLIGAITSSVLLFGISLVYGVTGSTYLPRVAEVLAAGTGTQPVLLAGMLFLLVGFAFKVAAFPFHMWAPDTYDGSPTPISAFLITGSEAAGFAALLRIFTVGLPGLSDQWAWIFAVLAVLTMTYGNVTAIVQTKIKRLMAYSAIAQAGYVLVGLAVATGQGAAAMLYYLLVYAFMTVGAFGVIILLTNNGEGEEIADFRGLGQRSPVFAWALVIYFLSLIGIPPTAGFFGKLGLFNAAIAADMTWLAVVMVINSVLSAPYYFGVIRSMFLEEAEEARPLRAPASLTWAMGITVLVTLALGLLPEQVYAWVQTVAGSL
ncbi:NADH-quinone oxidoreductase subunit N [Limnochorda pilosa]|uniref:NADH-quinone oxidoreductase subunit N n=1 Tax=Limnochorda pilosa TaxID=1555112 RepID=A0A0K2SKP2_LIMPI|nr:NADH-quinone oxidoreductase subunit N [Limnochorda pilosa]BAS27671.1 NADH-quinone oxidoreductase subunit N [Limnochorda pilosa]